jgi:hypothetical protein
MLLNTLIQYACYDDAESAAMSGAIGCLIRILIVKMPNKI